MIFVATLVGVKLFFVVIEGQFLEEMDVFLIDHFRKVIYSIRPSWKATLFHCPASSTHT